VVSCAVGPGVARPEHPGEHPAGLGQHGEVRVVPVGALRWRISSIGGWPRPRNRRRYGQPPTLPAHAGTDADRADGKVDAPPACAQVVPWGVPAPLVRR
jgi:hypothetical protein